MCKALRRLRDNGVRGNVLLLPLLDEGCVFIRRVLRWDGWSLGSRLAGGGLLCWFFFDKLLIARVRGRLGRSLLGRRFGLRLGRKIVVVVGRRLSLLGGWLCRRRRWLAARLAKFLEELFGFLLPARKEPVLKQPLLRHLTLRPLPIQRRVEGYQSLRILCIRLKLFGLTGEEVLLGHGGFTAVFVRTPPIDSAARARGCQG
mmetsp:Transcript_25581/g.65011  ORF Transcript_25581/g.65011 Transcript_25581/m.65011 type:complete len:202 (-) Transcript_25581:41-646(-)